MRRIIVIVTGFVIAVALGGCGGGQGKVAGFKKGPMPPGYTWDGKYYCHTPYEEMNLVQTGSTVVGTVEYKNGRIEGTANGNLLIFTWSQDAGHTGLTGSTTRISGKGVFQYKVEETAAGKEKHNVYGQWGYDQEMTGGGKWDCYKSKKDIKKVKKTLMIDEEGAVEAAAKDTEADDEDDEESTKIKDVGVKEKKKEKPTYEDVGAPDTGDERLEDLDDLDF